MKTLLLRLAAPMQSWGISAKFERRSTERVPSKSAVIGLIAGALGRRRNESIDDLSVLAFGLRVDSDGVLLRDFQIAQSIKKSLDKTNKPKNVYYKLKNGYLSIRSAQDMKKDKSRHTYLSIRDYIADAAFLVGLEGDEELLQRIDFAIRHPVFPIFLGRRSCPPEGRVSLGIRDLCLMDALKAEPWLTDDPDREDEVRFVLDAAPDDEESYILRDKPVSFDQGCRRFAFRRIKDVREKSDILADTDIDHAACEPETDHDAFQGF